MVALYKLAPSTLAASSQHRTQHPEPRTLMHPDSCCCLFQQPLKHRPQPTVPAITAGDLMTRLYIFADDSMQGREAGTLAHIKGTDYIAAELKRHRGATPGGDKGTFYQDFGLEEVGTEHHA